MPFLLVLGMIRITCCVTLKQSGVHCRVIHFFWHKGNVSPLAIPTNRIVLTIESRARLTALPLLPQIPHRKRAGSERYARTVARRRRKGLPTREARSPKASLPLLRFPRSPARGPLARCPLTGRPRPGRGRIAAARCA